MSWHSAPLCARDSCGMVGTIEHASTAGGLGSTTARLAGVVLLI